MGNNKADVQSDYKRKIPERVKFLDKTIYVKNWRDLFIKCVEELIKMRPEGFNELLQSKKHGGRYISKDDINLREPYRLSNGLFLETHYGSNSIVRILKNKFIKGCGFQETDLEIFLKD